MTVGAVVVVVVYGCLSVCEPTEKDFLFALESIGISHHPRSTSFLSLLVFFISAILSLDVSTLVITSGSFLTASPGRGDRQP
jgi:hypothetical protein